LPRPASLPLRTRSPARMWSVAVRERAADRAPSAVAPVPY